MNLFGARAATVALVLAAALAGCTSTSGTGSGKGSTANPTPTTSSQTSSTAESTATSSAPPPTPATSTEARPPAHPEWCTAAQLGVAGGPLPGGSAAGHTGVLLTFTNHSSARCVLYGYPGVAGLNASGSQIAQASRTFNGYLAGCRCTSLPSVSLTPGAIASAVTEGTIGSGECDMFTALLVTPPNTATSTRVDMVPHSCGFTVHPVVAGSTGSG
jgi:hypothetical protein